MMQVPITADMLAALKSAAEKPDTLVKAVDAAKADGRGFVLPLTGDQAIAITEMCEWHIRTDPATGKVTADTKVWDDIVRAVQRAEEG